MQCDRDAEFARVLEYGLLAGAMLADGVVLLEDGKLRFSL
jgi:hypothetical protein